MQTGIGFNNYEIKKLICDKASDLTDVSADMLNVHISAGYGTVQACVVHIDGESNIELKEL